MGEPTNPHFYYFGTFERVPEPQNQYYLSFETPGYLQNQENGTYFKLYFYKSRSFRNRQCWKFLTPDKSIDLLNKFLNILDMRSIFTKKHEMFFIKWNQHLLKTFKDFINGKINDNESIYDDILAIHSNVITILCQFHVHYSIINQQIN